MFFLCCVPFHLTASFHAIPRGPESGDLVVHVTVIIFFNGDKDMDSRDSAQSLSSSATTLILFGDSASVLDRNVFSQSKVGAHIVYSNILTAYVCVYQKHTLTGANMYAHLCTQKNPAV